MNKTVLVANTLPIISFYSMWHMMPSDIPSWNKQTNIKTFLYNNLAIHPIWVCCIDFMSLSHTEVVTVYFLHIYSSICILQYITVVVVVVVVKLCFTSFFGTRGHLSDIVIR